MHIIKRLLQFVYYTLFKQGTFFYRGMPYRYFYHLMNVTFSNERAIEIPLALSILETRKHLKVLEVGNVLHWYSCHRHPVVDKYEKGCINEDIVDFKTRYKYDLIISVSTLEHVGFDEEDKDPEKIYKAIENMKSLVRKCGLIFVTIPVGQSPIDFKRVEEQFNVFDYLQWENGDEIFVGYSYL